MGNNIFITVIMPVRNEAKHIRRSLDSILAQDYPREHMEVIVADGMSEDETRDIVTGYCNHDKRILLISNPKQITPCGLNVAIGAAKGEIIVRVDGHWYVPPDLLKQVVRLFEERGIDCLGGRIAREVDTEVGRPIELARSSLLGGSLSIRNDPAAEERPTQEPNIAHIWRKGVFDKVGLFDERFVKNQDNEFNLRSIRAGLRTLYSPDILYHQYVPDNFRRLFCQMFAYASYIPMLNFKHRTFLNIHLAVPAILLLLWLVSLILEIAKIVPLAVPFVSIGAYILLVSTGAFITSLKAGKVKWCFGILTAYIVIHNAVILGYLRGILRLLNSSMVIGLWRDTKGRGYAG